MNDRRINKRPTGQPTNKPQAFNKIFKCIQQLLQDGKEMKAAERAADKNTIFYTTLFYIIHNNYYHKSRNK